MLGLVTDAIGIPLARLNRSSALFQRFDKVWSKHSEDGVDVYNSRLKFYKNGRFDESIRMRKFCEALGIKWEEFISQEVDGEITQMYFKLKAKYRWDGSVRPGGTPEIPDEDYLGVTHEQIRDAINGSMTVGDELVVTVAYGGDTKRYVEQHSIEWTATGTDVVSSPFNSSEVRAVLHSQPWFYFANIRDDGDIDSTVQWQTINQGTNDVPLDRIDGAGVNRVLSNAPVCDVACDKSAWGIFALMEDTQVFQPIGVAYDDRMSTVDMGLEGQALRYEYKLKFKFKGCTLTSKIVNEVYARHHQVMIANSEIGNAKLAKDKANGAIDTKYKSIMDDMNPEPTNSLYYKGYLRVDAAHKMKRNDFAEMLSKNIKTDYDVEEASTFEKIMAVVIIIIAIVVAFYCPACSAALGQAGAIAAGAVVLSLGSMMLAQFGGLSAVGLAGRIGQLAEYFGYAAMITGIYAALQNAWQQASADALAQQAAKESAMQASEGVVIGAVEEVSTTQILGQMATNAFNSAISSVTNMVNNFMNSATNLGNMSFTETISAINRAVGMASDAMKWYADKEQEELQKEYRELEKEKEAYENSSNNTMKDPLMVLGYVQEYCSAYDGINLLRMATDNKIGQGTFNKWNAERASI